MYSPSHFAEHDPQRLADLIESHGFATLVSVHEGMPFATHLPLLYDAAQGAKGVLYGHMARANPQWRAFAGSATVLAIFHGPHAYVSPSWYATPGVPTWNYCVAHVYGKPRLLDDRPQLARVLDALIARYDAPVADAQGPVLAAEKRERMLEAIVGFAIDVDAIEGKFKLSQNRSREDQQRVITRLGQMEAPDAQALAGLMLQNLVTQR